MRRTTVRQAGLAATAVAALLVTTPQLASATARHTPLAVSRLTASSTVKAAAADCATPANGKATCDSQLHTCGVMCDSGFRSCNLECIPTSDGSAGGGSLRCPGPSGPFLRRRHGRRR